MAKKYRSWSAVPVGMPVVDRDGDLWRKTDDAGGFEWWPQQGSTVGEGWRAASEGFGPSTADAPYVPAPVGMA